MQIKDTADRDLAKKHAEEDSQDAWFMENEQDLEELFFVRHNLLPDEDPKHWERFLEGQWEQYRYGQR